MKDLFTRSKHNPILSPDLRHEWESLKVFNPGAIYHEGKYHLFYRASGSGSDWHSSLGYAVSKDGEHFKRFDHPLLDRDSSNPLELRGLEDPRITKISDTFYMTYAAYDGKVPRLFVATSNDLKNWKRNGPVLRNFDYSTMGGVSVKWDKGKAIESPADSSKRDRSKAAGIFPERINGKYYMLFNELRMWMATSDDGIHWDAMPNVFLGPRKGTNLFDNIFVEMGPAPIKTEKGWLVLYHGVNDAIQYHLGVLLLDLNDPTEILYRSDEPIFGPKDKIELSGIVDIIPGVVKLIEQGKEQELKERLQEAERGGFMPQVTFVTAAVVVDGVVRLYYGASDVFICTATATLKDILATIP